MHRVLHASKSAWHHCAPALCDILASVAADMTPLAHALASPQQPAATAAPREPQAAQKQAEGTGSASSTLAPRPRLLSLASVSATLATVMLYYPSARIALSASVMQRHLGALLAFASDLVSKSKATGATDAALPSVLQFAAAWLALMHRVTPLHALARALEAPCECAALSGALPRALPPSWRRFPMPPAQSASPVLAAQAEAAVARPVNAAVDAAVVCMVERAFTNVLEQHSEAADGGAGAMASGEGTTPAAEELVERRSGVGGGVETRLPMWLALLALSCAALGGAAPRLLTTADAETSPLARMLPSTPPRLQAASWGVLNVLTPALVPIAAFCAHVAPLHSEQGELDTESKTLPWAQHVWRSLLADTPRVLLVPSADAPDVSRAVAAYLVTQVTLEAGEGAVVHVCIFVRQCSDELAASSTSAAATDADDTKRDDAQAARARFRVLFAIHLLQTAVRRQGQAARSRVALARHLASLLEPQRGDSATHGRSAEADASPASAAAGTTSSSPDAIESSSSTGAASHKQAGLSVSARKDRTALAGLDARDRLQIVCTCAAAVQQASALQSSGALADTSVSAATVFTHAAHGMLRALTQAMEPIANPGAAASGQEDEQGSALDAASVSQATTLAAVLQQLAPVLPAFAPQVSTLLLHCVDLHIVAASLLAASTDVAVSVDLNPSLAGPLPGQAAPEPVNSSADPASATCAQFLSSAAALLRCAVSARLLDSREAALRVASLCAAASGVPQPAADVFAAGLQTLAASAPIARAPTEAAPVLAAVPGHNAAARLQECSVAVKASVDTMQKAGAKRQAPSQLTAQVAHALARDLLHTLSAPAEPAAKVLRAPGTHPSSVPLTPRASCLY
jgi:hypothetical protein